MHIVDACSPLEPTALIELQSVPAEVFADCPGLLGPGDRERGSCSGSIVVDSEVSTPADYEAFAQQFAVAA